MKVLLLCAALLLSSTAGVATPKAVDPVLLADIKDEIVDRLTGPRAHETPAQPHRTFRALASMAIFYQRRDYTPLWHTADGQLTDAALSFIDHLPDVVSDGLVPDDYHVAGIKALSSSRWPSAGLIAQRELLLSDGFLLLALHLRDGRVKQDTFEPRLRISGVAPNLLRLLDEAVQYERVVQTLDALRPALEGYWLLRRALPQYYAVEAVGGWPALDIDFSLREGDEGPAVTRLRQRLAAEPGLGVAVEESSTAFDSNLARIVKSFQSHHGLARDGVVGPATRAVLNVPAHARIRQIEANLERWRWLPQDLGSRFVVVNIANYSLTAHVDHEVVLTMKVVVGKPYRRTPVFIDEIEHLVLNPSWEVPNTILYEDIIPGLRRDPGMLARQNFRLFGTTNGELREVDPSTVNWSAVLAPGRPFPFRLRQLPGATNPLGKMKFMFPNKYDVYLHDTPARELFKRRVRDFSSGCIRVENPTELALFLLDGDARWTPETLQAAVEMEKERYVPLAQTVPIYIQYFTVWNGRDNVMQFREDIYGRDDALAEALALRS